MGLGRHSAVMLFTSFGMENYLKLGFVSSRTVLAGIR